MTKRHLTIVVLLVVVAVASAFFLQGDWSEGEAAKGSSFLSLIAGGGWLMLPILGCSLALAAVAAGHFGQLAPSRLLPQSLRNLTQQLCQTGNAMTAETVQRGCRAKPSPFGDMLLELFRNRGSTRTDLACRVSEVVSLGVAKLRMRNSIYSYVGRTATFLGLLGTVVGMIVAFAAVAELEGPDKRAVLAGGISKALVTTMSGVAVAIIANALEFFFSRKIGRFELESFELLTTVSDQLCHQSREVPASLEGAGR